MSIVDKLLNLHTQCEAVHIEYEFQTDIDFRKHKDLASYNGFNSLEHFPSHGVYLKCTDKRNILF